MILRPLALFGLAFWGITLLTQACTPQKEDHAGQVADSAPGPREKATGLQIGADSGVDLPGVHNVLQLSEGIFIGSQPDGEAGFATLTALGIKTVLSVDGAKPDVVAAEKHGLRYVHVPVGYHGISRAQAVSIVRTALEMPSPVFIHCHHGKHRGPTAAALALIQVEGFSADQAVDAMKRAKTSPNYRGLYDCVRGFTPISDEEMAASAFDFPSQAAIGAKADAMVELGRHFEPLALSAKRTPKFVADAQHPDIDLSHQALLVEESFTEALRAPWVEQEAESFRDYLRDGQEAARQLGAALRAYDPKQEDTLYEVEDAFELIGRSCGNCHNDFRNSTPVE